jgi:hypothetical protein
VDSRLLRSRLCSHSQRLSGGVLVDKGADYRHPRATTTPKKPPLGAVLGHCRVHITVVLPLKPGSARQNQKKVLAYGVPGLPQKVGPLPKAYASNFWLHSLCCSLLSITNLHLSLLYLSPHNISPVFYRSKAAKRCVRTRPFIRKNAYQPLSESRRW